MIAKFITIIHNNMYVYVKANKRSIYLSIRKCIYTMTICCDNATFVQQVYNEDRLIHMNNGSEITLRNIQKEDSGEYICQVRRQLYILEVKS